MYIEKYMSILQIYIYSEIKLARPKNLARLKQTQETKNEIHSRHYKPGSKNNN
jgi:hypothetical protein